MIFDSRFSAVPYMQKGEVPPHWSDLVAKHSKYATDENIDVANIWVAKDLTHEGNQDDIDPNLVLTRYFSGHPPQLIAEQPPPKTISFSDKSDDDITL